jgi:hypothetical protein
MKNPVYRVESIFSGRNFLRKFASKRNGGASQVQEEGDLIQFRDSVAVASVTYCFHLGLLLGALASSWGAA